MLGGSQTSPARPSDINVTKNKCEDEDGKMETVEVSKMYRRIFILFKRHSTSYALTSLKTPDIHSLTHIIQECFVSEWGV